MKDTRGEVWGRTQAPVPFPRGIDRDASPSQHPEVPLTSGVEVLLGFPYVGTVD